MADRAKSGMQAKSDFILPQSSFADNGVNVNHLRGGRKFILHQIRSNRHVIEEAKAAIDDGMQYRRIQLNWQMR